ncbi:MAG: branched-chain amino acid ABC transporter permease [Dehalococcoidia bacterium]|nr:branched-chain amino acid ABC transporter permease [Dehalococcoidia bacterium]
MRRLAPLRTSTVVIFGVLAFFLLWWIPFSHVLPDVVPLRFAPYRTLEASQVAVWVIVAVGLNILTGFNGQISLGHGAFVAIGAYTAAILMVDHGWPFWTTIIAGGVLAGGVGFLVGVPALRLTGPYLAMATLGLALATPQVLSKYEGLTHGNQGINVRPEVPPPPAFIKDWFGLSLSRDEWMWFLVLSIVLIMLVLALNIVRSRIGRAFVAIRDSEIAAQAMGISVPRYKTMAFAISAFYAGVAGGTYALVHEYIAPENFNITMSMNLLTTIVIGGLASILGSVLGAIGLVVVPELPELVFNRIPGVNIPVELSWAFYGVVLILIMIFAPYGLAGLFHRSVRWVSSWTLRSRAGILVGLVVGVATTMVVGFALGLVAFLVTTAWVWAPPLVGVGARGYSRWIGALTSPLASAGETEAGPEDQSSQDHPDAER